MHQPHSFQQRAVSVCKPEHQDSQAAPGACGGPQPAESLQFYSHLRLHWSNRLDRRVENGANTIKGAAILVSASQLVQR
jgi:hypothetical protein